MKFTFLFFNILLVISCNENSGKEKNAIEVLRTEIPPELKHVKINIPNHMISPIKNHPSKYNVFYIFDNGCSSCISQFIEVVNNFQALQGKKFSNTSYFFITTNKDTANIRYYMNKYQILLTPNQHLLADKEYTFQKLNSAVLGNKEVNYILTDTLYHPISLGDPFSDFNSRTVYDSLEILTSHPAQ